jgi:uncharacterized radical SAM superfamily Fe-S cluster-containing enzyme
MLLTRLHAAKTVKSNKPWELPVITQSLCPQCLGLTDARIYEENNRVFMDKTCPDHGPFTELISSDAQFFLKMRRTHYEVPVGVENPQCMNTSHCPDACGICDQHLSTPVMVNIDLTNRCNLRCPICFANAAASGKVYEITLEQLERMLDAIKAIRPYSAPCFQFVGGEPTIHPHFIEAVRMVKACNISQIQVASNGIRFAADFDFTRRTAEAGLDVVYLQFDGMSDDVYKQCRGRPLLETKLKAVENIGKAGMRIMLVPTLAKGLNDHQLGDMLRFAMENADIIGGISWQPVAITGRIDEKKRLEMRFTLADLARGLEEQTGGMLQMHRDWFPFSMITPFTRLVEVMTKEPQMRCTCHPHCGCATYLIVDMHTKNAVPLPAIIDVEAAMRTLDKAVARIEKHPWLKNMSMMQAFRQLKKHFRQEIAPPGWCFEDFIEFMTSFLDLPEQRKNGREYVSRLKTERFNAILMAAMHFQDSYNYDVDRSRHCIVHYAAPNGRFYPFCTWNSGPCHRQSIERQFARPLTVAV